MTNSNARVVVASVVGLLIGAAVGWWLHGDAPAVETEPAKASPAESPRRSVASPRGEHSTRSRPSIDESARDRSDAMAEPSNRPDATASERPSDARQGVNGTPTDPTVAATPSTKPRPSSPPRATPHEAAGVVIDATTQRPIADARVLFAIADGPAAGHWWGATSDADGRFHPSTDDDSHLAGAHVELRVSKPGYESVRVPVTEGETRIELRPRTAPVVPGRVVGLARSADGKPFRGPIVVEGVDESGNWTAQRAQADAGGAFALDGMPSGSWRLRWDGGKTVDVTVPEGGEARVELAAPPDGERSNFVVTDVDPSKVRLDDPAAKTSLDGLLRLLGEVDQTAALDAGARERLRRSLALEVQRLVATTQAALPRRDVVVSGLATDGRGWLRLETKPRDFWRVEIRGGEARVTSVPIGSYSGVIEQPGRPERSVKIVIPAGDGEFQTPFR